MSMQYLINTRYKKDNLELWYWDETAKKIVKTVKNDDHSPYLLTDENSFQKLTDKSLVTKSEVITKYDPTNFKNVQLLKLCTKHPREIFDKRSKTGLRTLLTNSWEDNIRYENCYIIDTKRIFCLPDNFIKEIYTIPNNKLKEFLFNHFMSVVKYPVFKMPKKALDIEIYNENSEIDAKTANLPIISCAIVDNSRKLVYVHRDYLDESLSFLKLVDSIVTKYKTSKGTTVEYVIRVCNTEYELHKAIFTELSSGHFTLYTFNGDEFDLKYIYNRAKKLGFKDEDIPIIIDFNGRRTSCYLRNSLHIDIQKLFNTGVLSYAYPIERYPSLNDVASVIVGETKLEINVFNKVSKQLCDYCLNDALLVYKITEADNETLPTLITLLSRIYNVSLEQLSRTSLSRLNYMLFQYVHRLLNYLIPNKQYFLKKSAELTLPKGKVGQYKGGEVIFSNPGIYFDVDVYDFTSEYPGVIDSENLSYETLGCPHEECRKNVIEGHNFHVCTKFKGVVSALFLSLIHI